MTYRNREQDERATGAQRLGRAEVDDTQAYDATEARSGYGYGEASIEQVDEQPSDWEIYDQVSSLLQRSDLVESEGLEVSVEGGQVIVRGAAANAQAVRAIEEHIKSIPGVRRVQNRLRAQ